MLAYLYRYPDGLFVNLEITRQGYGRMYTGQPFKHWTVFRTYERKAREVSKGLWGEPEKEEPPAARTPQPVVSPPIPTPRTTVPPVAKRDPIVYVTKTGKKYHSGGCQCLRRSRIAKPLSEAKRAGYTSCSRCGPPR